MRVIGLDIGGANLKAADNDGHAVSRPFALWKNPQQLAETLQSLLALFSPAERLAVTMTGELCDCFQTKAEGVGFLLSTVQQVAAGVPVFVWQTGGEFVSPAVAGDIPRLVAAANWHALATFCGRMVPRGTALLLDIGSTTTDIIPLMNGLPANSGLTDVERLEAGELVYVGIRRTPLCALSSMVPFGSGQIRPAAEFFATTLDVHLWRGDIAENPTDIETANRRPATREEAARRLARMLCCDETELSAAQLDALAQHGAEMQQSRIAEGLNRVLATLSEPCRAVILSGSGEFLARLVVGDHPALHAADVHSLAQIFGASRAEAACAFAVAKLAAEII